MEKFIELLKNNPKKAIVILIALLVFAVGNVIINGCAFHLSGADNVSGSIKPLGVDYE